MTSGEPFIDSNTIKSRLAGPSTNKSGLQNVDHEKVNQIIYDTSYGTAFYDNEKRKDEALQDRIKAVNQKLEYAIKHDYDFKRDEKDIDAILERLKKTRDLSQTIVHCDCDAFYASVEESERPELKSLPLAVGSNILTTANYVARKFGVRSAMPAHIARRLCPDLIVVPCDFSKYTKKAEEIRVILKTFDPVFKPVGLDESYLNLTKYLQNVPDKSADEVVREMRTLIFEKVGITVSCGVAANTRLAKICSNVNKPNGQFILENSDSEIEKFLETLPVRNVIGIGRVLEAQLKALDVSVCGDIYRQRAKLKYAFQNSSRLFEFLLHVHLGLGSNIIKPSDPFERKSIGNEKSFRPISDTEALKKILFDLANEVSEDCKTRGILGHTLRLKLKFNTFKLITRQCTLPQATNKATVLYKHALELLKPELPTTARLLGIQLTNLIFQTKTITNFFRTVKDDDSKGEEEESNSDLDFHNELEKMEQDNCTANDNETHRDSIQVKASPEIEEINTWTCFLCKETMMNCNNTINQHIDECLNRDIISKYM